MMRLADVPEHVEHFRTRVLQDALNEATAAYWLRRAEAFRWALPRPGDYTGRATPEEVAERRTRLLSLIEACRARASFALGGDR